MKFSSLCVRRVVDVVYFSECAMSFLEPGRLCCFAHIPEKRVVNLVGFDGESSSPKVYVICGSQPPALF